MTHLSLPFASGICIQPHLPAEESICLAASKGCSHTYIDLNHGMDHLQHWSPARIRECRKLADDLGVCFVIHGNLQNPLACEHDELRKGAIEYTAGEIRLASDLLAPLILHASSYFPGRKGAVNRGTATHSFIKSLQQVEPIARNLHTSLWLENLPQLPGHPRESVFCQPSDYEGVFSKVAGLSMVYDLGHANINNPHPEAILSSAVCPIIAICLSDNDGRSDAHRSLGDGEIHWRAFLNKVAETAWRGMVIFETMGAAPDKEILFLSKYFSAS